MQARDTKNTVEPLIIHASGVPKKYGCGDLGESKGVRAAGPEIVLIVHFTFPLVLRLLPDLRLLFASSLATPFVSSSHHPQVLSSPVSHLLPPTLSSGYNALSWDSPPPCECRWFRSCKVEGWLVVRHNTFLSITLPLSYLVPTPIVYSFASVITFHSAAHPCPAPPHHL